MKNVIQETAAQQIMDFMRGYTRGNLYALEIMPSWDEVAFEILERRKYHFLEILPDELLQAIASQEVDMNKLIAKNILGHKVITNELKKVLKFQEISQQT